MGLREYIQGLQVRNKNIMTHYHASPHPNLHKTGITPDADPHVSVNHQNYVYLGSLDYIINHYLKYAHSGTYYVYKINTSGTDIISDLPGEQVRTRDYIAPTEVDLFKVVQNEPERHPEEANYREWYRSKGYEV